MEDQRHQEYAACWTIVMANNFEEKRRAGTLLVKNLPAAPTRSALTKRGRQACTNNDAVNLSIQSDCGTHASIYTLWQIYYYQRAVLISIRQRFKMIALVFISA